MPHPGLINPSKKFNKRVDSAIDRQRKARLNRKKRELAALNKKREDEIVANIQRQKRDLKNIGKPKSPLAPALSAADQLAGAVAEKKRSLANPQPPSPGSPAAKLAAAVAEKRRLNPSAIEIQDELNRQRAVEFEETQRGIDRRVVENAPLLEDIQNQTQRVLSPDELQKQTERRAFQKQRREGRAADATRRAINENPEAERAAMFERANANRARRGLPAIGPKVLQREPMQVASIDFSNKETVKEIHFSNIADGQILITEDGDLGRFNNKNGVKSITPLKTDLHTGEAVIDERQIELRQFQQELSHEERALRRKRVMASGTNFARSLNDIQNQRMQIAETSSNFSDSAGDRMRQEDIQNELELLDDQEASLLFTFAHSGLDEVEGPREFAEGQGLGDVWTSENGRFEYTRDQDGDVRRLGENKDDDGELTSSEAAKLYAAAVDAVQKAKSAADLSPADPEAVKLAAQQILELQQSLSSAQTFYSPRLRRDITKQEIAEAAKNKNISEEEVKRDLGITQ
ncbi:MAG: hypothetical protein IH984_07470 [Planctomycetes bacterium]|nr:hypothetical protein [Planctomycetota bacterium]